MKELSEIFKKYGVKIAYLFGSQKEKGIQFLKGKAIEPDKSSDLDIGVVFEKIPAGYISLYGDIYVDLSEFFSPFNIDLVFLQETDVFLQFEAINGEVIYCEDEEFLDEYEEMVMKKASDLAFKRKEFEKDFLEAIRDGYCEIKLK